MHRERGERRDERLILEVIDIYWDSMGAYGLSGKLWSLYLDMTSYMDGDEGW